MSGFAAIFMRDGGRPSEALLGRMLDAVRHRGPDREGQLIAGAAGLAHCLLATTDEDSLDAQPLAGDDGRCWIVADARLDNREELLALDAQRLDDAPPRSDAALILDAYRRWGLGCASKLLGDFAFAIWDAGEQRLYCARDQIGVRPLFYHDGARGLRCASTMQAVLADPAVSRRPHLLSVALYLQTEYTENGQTLYEGVRALPAAHYLTVSRGSVRVQRYWEPDPWRFLPPASDEEYAELFHDTFRAAVRCRLRSNRPLAAHVSGGMDSSSVACMVELLRRDGYGPRQPPTLTQLIFPGLDCDESVFGRAVADRWGLPWVGIEPAEDRALCEPKPGHADLYYHPTVLFLLPTLKEAARRGARTTLTGLGGDQLLYDVPAACGLDVRAGRLAAVAHGTGLLPRPWSRAAWRAFLPRAVTPLLPGSVPAAWHWLRARSAPQPAWFAPALARELRERERERERRRDRAPERLADLVVQARRELIEGWTATYQLAVADRGAASVGAEHRHPFFDLRLVELALGLPHAQRFDAERWTDKAILRRAMDGILPTPVRHRRKAVGFTSYVRHVVLVQHGRAVQQLLARSRLVEAGIVTQEGVSRVFEKSRDASRALRYVVNLAAMELWLRGLDG
ncbi:MAG: hypothetical protein HY744_22580 [Deltaproteobacteria bacterium]|nr:hypothetical protein [Deltaproteobacteria bacterium]